MADNLESISQTISKMKIVLGFLGYASVIGFTIKIMVQMYFKYKQGEQIKMGPGRYLGMEYFLPIKEDVESNFYWIKKIANFFYYLSICFIAIAFLYELIEFFVGWQVF